MRLVIRHANPVGDRMVVEREDGDVAYRVVGRPAHAVTELTIKSDSGAELLVLRRDMAAPTPTFRLQRSGDRVGSMWRRMSLRPSYVAEVAGETVRVRSARRGSRHTFTSAGRAVAAMIKLPSEVPTAYLLEAAEAVEDPVVLVGLAVAVDNLSAWLNPRA